MLSNELTDKETSYFKEDFTNTPFDKDDFPEPLELTVLIKFINQEEQPGLQILHAEFQFDTCLGFGTELHSTRNNLTSDKENLTHIYEKKFQIPKMTEDIFKCISENTIDFKVYATSP